MKSAYKFERISENGHWAYYCTTHDLPKIIKLKNDKFKVDAGKESRIEDTWDAAVKYAVSYGKKMAKAIKKMGKGEYMILTDADMELYFGPIDGDAHNFNYKSKLFKATFESQKGNIKVCPHCNGTKFRIKDSYDNKSRYISVVCSSCKSIGPRSRYNIWHSGNLAEWHLYDENMVDTTKDEVIKKAIDLWNN